MTGPDRGLSLYATVHALEGVGRVGKGMERNGAKQSLLKECWIISLEL